MFSCCCWRGKVASADTSPSDLLRALVTVAFRAGYTMESLRATTVFDKLVDKKGETARFAVDVVTLADIIIQGVAERIVEDAFPPLKGRVYGEEEEKSGVEDYKSPSTWKRADRETAHGILHKTIFSPLEDGDAAAADADAVVSGIFDPVDDAAWTDDILRDVYARLDALADSHPSLFADPCLWMDPLDATNEYAEIADTRSGLSNAPGESAAGKPSGIARAHSGADVLGRLNHAEKQNRRSSAVDLLAPAEPPAETAAAADPIGRLKAVCFVCGVFDRATGVPLAGVVHQPFGKTLLWGVSAGPLKASNVSPARPLERQKPRIVLSRADSEDIADLLKDEFELDFVAGCGYKLLNVIEGEADAFALVKGSAYMWDTCGGHAVLLAMGGDIISVKTMQSITYSTNRQKAQHTNGFVAFTNPDIGKRVAQLLQPLFKK